MGLPMWLSGKVSACQSRRLRKYEFDLWVRKIPWSILAWRIPRTEEPARLSPWSCKESDATEMT